MALFISVSSQAKSGCCEELKVIILQGRRNMSASQLFFIPLIGTMPLKQIIDEGFHGLHAQTPQSTSLAPSCICGTSSSFLPSLYQTSLSG